MTEHATLTPVQFNGPATDDHRGDYQRFDAPQAHPEPKVDDPFVGMSIAQRIRAAKSAKPRNLVALELPSSGETVEFRRIGFEELLLTGRLPTELTNAVQEALGISDTDLDTARESDQHAESMGGEIVKKLGVIVSIQAGVDLAKAWCLVAMETPTCVASEGDITDPANQISLDDLTFADFMAVATLFGAQQKAAVATVAPFPDAPGVAHGGSDGAAVSPVAVRDQPHQ